MTHVHYDTDAVCERAILQNRAALRDSLLRAERELTAIKQTVDRLRSLADADVESDLVDHSLDQIAVGLAAVQHAARYATTTTT